jgi:hypothetical protein
MKYDYTAEGWISAEPLTPLHQLDDWAIRDIKRRRRETREIWAVIAFGFGLVMAVWGIGTWVTATAIANSDRHAQVAE